MGTDNRGIDWSEFAKGIIRSELKRRNMTYAALVAALAEIGVTETEPNLRNKISRGNFSAAFMLQCLDAMGVNALVLNTEALLGRRSFPEARRRIAEHQAQMDNERHDQDD